MIIGDKLNLYVQKLRSSNLRPTKRDKQEVLSDKKKTFHFTVETLNKKIKMEPLTFP